MTKLFYGPLNKSMYTQQLELLAKCILSAGEHIKFKFKESGDKSVLYATIDNLTINVSLLMSKADFSHIRLSEEDSNKYIQIMGNQTRRPRNQNDRNHLTNAEKDAITSYTGIHSSDVNELLYHNKTHLFDKLLFDSPHKRIIHSVMLASALNKISPKKGRKEYRLYRGEKSLSDAELEARKKLVAKKGISAQLAFFSTSTSKEVANRFRRQSVIVLKNAPRKSIKQYSRFKSEREHIQLPGFMQWTKYKFKNGLHKFYAKIVEPVIKKYNRPSDNEIKQFEDLKAWAISKNVNIDFLTPNLRARVKSPRLRKARALIEGTPVATLQGAFRGALVPQAKKQGVLSLMLGLLKYASYFFLFVSVISISVTLALWCISPELLGATLFKSIMPDLYILGSSLFTVCLASVFDKPKHKPNAVEYKISHKYPKGKKKVDQKADKPNPQPQKGIHYLRKHRQKQNTPDKVQKKSRRRLSHTRCGG